MKKRDFFWIPFTVSLVFGLIIGSTYKFFHAFPSADWAAKGQSFIERWLDKQEWFLQGFIPGALIGLVVGVALYKIRAKTNDTKNL